MLNIINRVRSAFKLPPHQKHSRTSKAAAIANEYRFPIRTAELLMVFQSIGDGMTDEEGQKRLKIEGNSYRPMRVSLTSLGLVQDTGLTRRVKSGRTAIVWEISPKGISACNQRGS